MKKIAITLGLGLIATIGVSASASAEQDPYIGQLMTIAGNTCPRDWLPTRGQLLRIADYELLYSMLGTIHGGDGRTTFALPDTAGRVILTEGQGPGLAAAPGGQKGATGAAGSGGTPTLALLQCISLQGSFPSR